MTRVGFTGTRVGMSRAQRRELEAVLNELVARDWVEVHHGDCVGADSQAHDVALTCGCIVVIHPPLDGRLRARRSGVVLPAKPYLERNRDIVRATEVLIVAPRSDVEALRSGTWATLRFAQHERKQVVVLLREGGRRFE